MYPVHNIPTFASYTAKYHAALYRYARCWLRRHGPADLVVYATFHDLWSYRETLPTESAIRSFLINTARHHCQALLYQKALHGNVAGIMEDI